MAKNFAEIAFSPSVREIQDRLGSRESYARMEKNTFLDGLTLNEVNFIANQDSFYMASIGENGFPYIQHRGGPRGFLKVLDAKRLGFIDFKGNMQYISVGNIGNLEKVSIIMVDYPSKTRLKLYATAEIIELNDQELFNKLNLENYKFRPERMMVFNIEAYDWNCPQHITPRYTLEEIDKAFSSQRKYTIKLEEEIKELRLKLTVIHNLDT